ncbi:hypothetical protein UM550_05095 [Staphylococcus aureus]|nr:hypothetical protein UM550_05095 [Staphylococcus aureus]
MYNILTALYLTTPKLSHYFYQYIKLLIIKHHSNHRTTLLKYLERFEIDKNQTGISTSSLVVQAMNENKYLQYNQKYYYLYRCTIKCMLFTWYIE